jgi:glycosyltransferase involved in cell wall biosynthesis
MQKICIVIPCFNEQYRLPLNEFIVSYNTSSYYYLFVNDGSKDLTINVLNELRKGKEDRIFILDCKENSGKAEAVRKGVLTALKLQDFSVIGYLDADLATPLIEISRIVNQITGNIYFAFGSRIKMIGSDINRKWHRHIFGRIFATIASKMLNIGVYDTQCGAKFFDSNIVENIFSEKFNTKWIFDLELFLRFKTLYKNIDINKIAKEVPLENWRDIGGSKLKLKNLITVPLELLKLMRQKK